MGYKLKTLGIDQSYTSTGWCLNHNGNIVHFSTIKTTGEDMYNRAITVADTIVALVKTHKVDVVNCEQLAYGMTGNATRDLAGLLFVIVTTLKRECPTVKVNLVSPTTLKKMATGSGKATKKDVIASVPDPILTQFKSCGFKVTTGLADLCDAYWLSKSLGAQ